VSLAEYSVTEAPGYNSFIHIEPLKESYSEALPTPARLKGAALR